MKSSTQILPLLLLFITGIKAAFWYEKKVYGVFQFDDKYVQNDYQNIQWNFNETNTTTLRSDKCFMDPKVEGNLSKGYDRSKIRLMFNTTELYPYWNNSATSLSFSVNCPRDLSNTEYFHMGGTFIDPKISYTRFIVHVGKCRKPAFKNSMRITDIEIRFYSPAKKDWISMKRRLDPLPKDACSLINNFRTIYIPQIPVERPNSINVL